MPFLTHRYRTQKSSKQPKEEENLSCPCMSLSDFQHPLLSILDNMLSLNCQSHLLFIVFSLKQRKLDKKNILFEKNGLITIHLIIQTSLYFNNYWLVFKTHSMRVLSTKHSKAES